MNELNPYESPRETEATPTKGVAWKFNLVLLIVAIAYPFLSLALMFSTTSVSRIPMMEHYIVFVFVLPIACSAAACWCAIARQREWVLILPFVVWMAAVGWFHHWLIGEIWATI